ncbi:hypothetical protein D3C76_1104200 [compost metagenome]
MRSISSTGRSWNAVSPALTEPTLTPSISTSTWSDSAPRMNSVVFLPGPPLLLRVTPGTLRSNSGTDCAWLRSISSRSITLVEARLARTGRSLRVAVTTCSSRVMGAAASMGEIELLPSSASAAGLKKGLRIKVWISVVPPARHLYGILHAECSAMPWSLQAGLRACEWSSSSCAAPSHACAQWPIAAFYSPTVAGAAPDSSKE